MKRIGMQTLQFASIVRTISQATNRSLAGTRVFVASDFQEVQPDNFEVAAAEWGLRLVHDEAESTSCPIILHATYAQVDGTSMAYSQTGMSFAQPLTAQENIDRARAGMPVVSYLSDELKKSGILRGERIAISLIIEPKTAVLALELQEAGADVAIYATAAEVNQDIANELSLHSIRVFANENWTPVQEHEAALALLDELKPTIIIDDGASFARLAQLERPELMKNIKGVAEETTSGIRAFEAMEKDGALTFPVIASNDSMLKTGFDNVHGTGESCVTTFLSIMGDSYVERNTGVAVIGFGPVGRGFARRMRTLGYRVVIVERNATVALTAQYEGFEIMPLADAVRSCNCVISATGVVHTIDLETLQSLSDGTVVGVIGGISNEIALDDLTALTHQHIAPSVPVTPLDLGNDSTALLLASGDGMNYTVSGGNPIEIMDLSFAVQLNAVQMLAENHEELGARVIRMDTTIDETIARSALYARGAQIDEPSEAEIDWTRTRFSDGLQREGAEH
ncbi:S-adenosyl-L-homocysteine hydrolase, NAD binding domain protein [Alloscardovia omnicolens]|nr:S-adenosyl-L-homocysteine hydrolase, NAD binding domain protein [Alloscardovia omnicolens]